jgi:hypothetical protein
MADMADIHVYKLNSPTNITMQPRVHAHSLQRSFSILASMPFPPEGQKVYPKVALSVIWLPTDTRTSLPRYSKSS